MRATSIGAGLLLMIVAACGGSSVVDPTPTTSAGGTAAGGGGTGGSGATTTSSSGGSGGVLSTCEQLEDDFREKIMAALECNPALAVEQCTGQEMIFDDCGCDMAANDHNPEAAQAARDAYDAWVAGGCGPIPCTWCVEPLPAYCEPGGSGSGNGRCVSAVN